MREPIQRLDIAKVYQYLGGELPLTTRPTWTPVYCPIHHGNSGSIHLEANKYHCFGCEAHGDGYDLLNLAEGLGMAEAKELAEQMGWFLDSGPVRGPARKTQNRARPKRPERR